MIAKALIEGPPGWTRDHLDTCPKTWKGLPTQRTLRVLVQPLVRQWPCLGRAHRSFSQFLNEGPTPESRENVSRRFQRECGWQVLTGSRENSRAPCLEMRLARLVHTQFKKFSVCQASARPGAMLQAWGMVSKQKDKQANEISKIRGEVLWEEEGGRGQVVRHAGEGS